MRSIVLKRGQPRWIDSDGGRGTKIQVMVGWKSSIIQRNRYYPTLPETNIAMENHHQNGGFSMAMLVSGRVDIQNPPVIP